MKTNLKGLAILARQNPLTENDWLSLLEERRDLLKPHMRNMSLKTLGDLKIVHDDINRGAGNGRTLRMGALVGKTLDRPPYNQYLNPEELKNVTGGPRFSLDTRGIFANDEIFYNGHYHWDFIREHDTLPATGQIIRFWGLTRDSDWIKAECLTEVASPMRKDDDEKRVRVKHLTITESNPQEICQFCHVTLRWLWEQLGDTVEAWFKHRQEILAQTNTLVSMIRQEKSLISIIEPK